MKHMNRWLAFLMIVAVICLGGCSKREVSGGTETTVIEGTEPVTTSMPVEETEEMLLPWENGGKQPDQYTWEEYEALSVDQKEAFFDSFESAVAFDNWMSRVTGASEVETMPWEDGGKQPEEYTWAEYEALTASQKEAFYDSLGSSVAFDNWVSRVTGTTAIETMPWEDGDKQPEEYTWAEYEALTASQKEAFFDSFGNAGEFEEWMAQASGSADAMPWEDGGKQPEEYTWAEYEALTASQKEAFFDSFDSPEAFDNWMNRVTGSNGRTENSGKQPEEYTWAEFEAMTPQEQEAFVDSFEDIDAFEAWYNANQQ